MIRELAIGGALLAAVTVTAAAATASTNDQVCPDLTTGHLDGGDETEITITAPEGTLIVSYCVKAGSAEQEEGPEIVVLPEGVESITISHSSGKEISHYSYEYLPILEPTTTRPSPPPPPPPPGGSTTTTGPGGGAGGSTTTVPGASTTLPGQPGTTAPGAPSPGPGVIPPSPGPGLPQTL